MKKKYLLQSQITYFGILRSLKKKCNFIERIDIIHLEEKNTEISSKCVMQKSIWIGNNSSIIQITALLSIEDIELHFMLINI
jgi:hypothetical protein